MIIFPPFSFGKSNGNMGLIYGEFPISSYRPPEAKENQEREKEIVGITFGELFVFQFKYCIFATIKQDTNKSKMQKKKVLLRSMAVLSLLGIQGSLQAQTQVPFMTVTNSQGRQIAKIELGNDSGFEGPKLNKKNGTLIIGGECYPIDEIGEIRFSTGVATGITQVGDVSNMNAYRRGVYSLAGQKIADKSGRLPKGVYIVDGRKTIIK